MQEHESSSTPEKQLEVNPFLLGMDASAFVLKSLSDVRPSDVEQALLLLPFTDALRLLSFLPIWLSKRTQVCFHLQNLGLNELCNSGSSFVLPDKASSGAPSPHFMICPLQGN